MVTPVVALTRDARIWLRALLVVVVLGTTVALLSHHVFTPWEFDLESTDEATRSKIPRVAVKP